MARTRKSTSRLPTTVTSISAPLPSRSRTKSVEYVSSHKTDLKIQLKSSPSVICIDGIELRPTVVFDTFWRWCAERKAMDDRRRAGQAFPWTECPTLTSKYFCMPYRVLDRGCQYLIREIIEKGSQEPREVVFRVILYDIFTRIETWELLKDALGELTWEGFDRRAYERVLQDALDDGVAIYTGAFFKPTGQRMKTGQPSHHYHLLLLEQLMEGDALLERMRTAEYLEDVYDFIIGFRGMGPFTAYQLLLNLSYSGVMKFGNMDFVVAGIGCVSGLRKMFGKERLARAKAANRDIYVSIMRWMADTQDEHFERLGLEFEGLGMGKGRRRVRLELADIEHSICEVDKYARAIHPRIVNGRKTFRREYAHNPAKILPPVVLPKAWSHSDRKVTRIRPSRRPASSRSSSLETLTVLEEDSPLSSRASSECASSVTLTMSECEVMDMIVDMDDLDADSDRDAEPEDDDDEIIFLSDVVTEVQDCQFFNGIQYLVLLTKPDGQEDEAWLSKDELCAIAKGKDALEEFGGEQYIIEYIADVRDVEDEGKKTRTKKKKKGTSREFLVFWEGYPEDDATWEPEEMLLKDAPASLEKFWKAQARGTRNPK
ncbi:hypothetical protein AAF712_007512 [Marasmius tenuissimus]|uniref:Chromo domain-containing protein n=1 Tax=Marasmius tenuissimus TaxID=585030 RepID=A0ABR2ZXC3_9AGAR